MGLANSLDNGQLSAINKVINGIVFVPPLPGKGCVPAKFLYRRAQSAGPSWGLNGGPEVS